MFAAPELSIYSVNGRDELALNGFVNESNIFAVCERINERLRLRQKPYNEPCFLLTNQSLDTVMITRLIKCMFDNQIKLKQLILRGNRLDDFDLRFALGDYIESSCGRFLAELDLSHNSIGDYGAICLLKALVSAKTSSTDRRITKIDLSNNLIAHPFRIIDAIPVNARHLVFAADVSPRSAMESALIHVFGLEDQRCSQVRRGEMNTQSLRIWEPDHDDC
jgi:hypothetical protein